MSERDVEAAVVDAIAAVARGGNGPIRSTSGLSDLGIDSIRLVTMFVALEETAAFDLSLASESIRFSEIKTVADVVSVVRQYERRA